MAGKDKLRKFAENLTFDNVIQPKFDEVFRVDYKLKNAWNSLFWKNSNPIVLELGCGKGEYSVEMAQMFPDKNFIGIDIKGARFWRGAKTALENSISNVAFIRTLVEFLGSFFGKNEISEIWITFPDPQLKSSRAKKRLTSPRFLNLYRQVLVPEGIIHLKTDSQELHEYTKELLLFNNQTILECTNDLYNSNTTDEVLSIKTHYEKSYLKQGKAITYIKFQVKDEIQHLPE